MTGMAWRIAASAAVVMLGIWAGLRVYSAHPPTTLTVAAPARPAGVRTPAGEASAPLPGDFAAGFDETAAPPARIPAQLPLFTLADMAGKPTSIAAWSGKSLVLNFWATWCAPCRREIPLLEALHGEWAERNVRVVGIAVDHREQVLAYARDFKIPYPLLIGEQDALDVAAQFGVDSAVFPFTVFTDRRGEVVALFLGELHRPQADLILSVVHRLDQDQVMLPEARESIAAGLRALAASPT